MKSRTMYMHTLDGRPASIQRNGDDVWMAFAGARHRAPLVTSLRRIRLKQQRCIRQELREWYALHFTLRPERPPLTRYGYVLVEVPL